MEVIITLLGAAIEQYESGVVAEGDVMLFMANKLRRDTLKIQRQKDAEGENKN